MAANRTKTVEYMLPMLGLATGTYVAGSAVYTNSADVTIYIPETTSRTFKSVTLEVAFHDSYTAAANSTAWGVQVSCNAGTNYTAVAQTVTASNSGEQMSLHLLADVTDEFRNRFGTGATGTCRWGFYLTGTTGWNNASAKLIITYEYDDTAHSTRVKTVRIPIESILDRATYTGTSIGTNQIPALDTFLPEASKVYRQVFFEFWANTTPSGTNDGYPELKLDSGAWTNFGWIEGGLQSPMLIRLLWDLTGLTTNATHNITVGFSANDSRFSGAGGWVTVTYEYDHASSTRIMNSILLGLNEESMYVKATGDNSYASVSRFISEPGTLTLAQSGVWVLFSAGTTAGTLNFKMGAQAYRAYLARNGTGEAGMHSFVHRIDSGGAQGAGFTLSKGWNTFSGAWYGNTTDYFGNVNCLVILNYTSDKHTDGDGAHAHSCFHLMLPSNRALTTLLAATPTAGKQPNIIESNYYLMSALLKYCNYAGTGANYAMSILAEYAGTEGPGSGVGWNNIYSTVSISGNERAFLIVHIAARPAFKRWPQDPDTDRMDVETNRQWFLWNNYGGSPSLGMWITYHSMVHNITGTVSGYTGDGSGITVDIFRTDNHEYLGSVTTSAGGGYTYTWYDDNVPLFAVARQDATHVGRSDNGNAA